MPHWTEYFDSFLSPFITILLFVIGYFTAFRRWEKQKKKEMELQFDMQRFHLRLESCMAVWGLLKFLSVETENSDSFIVVRGKKENGDLNYVFRREPAERFIDAVPSIFLSQGHGLFMPKEIRDLAYNLVHIIRKPTISLLHNNSEEEELSKPQIAEKILSIREELRLALLAEVEKNPGFLN